MHARFERVCEEAEIDEQWSFAGNKSNQRWLWYAVDHESNTVFAYVFGKRKDNVFNVLKALLEPFNFYGFNSPQLAAGLFIIKRYYTDDRDSYTRFLAPDKHEIGKGNTQKIERKNLNSRTWIKRLIRKIILFFEAGKNARCCD